MAPLSPENEWKDSPKRPDLSDIWGDEGQATPIRNVAEVKFSESVKTTPDNSNQFKTPQTAPGPRRHHPLRTPKSVGRRNKRMSMLITDDRILGMKVIILLNIKMQCPLLL